MIFCNLENKENNMRLISKNVHRTFCDSVDLGKLEIKSIKTQNGRKYYFSTCTSAQPWEGFGGGGGRRKRNMMQLWFCWRAAASLMFQSISGTRRPPSSKCFFLLLFFQGCLALKTTFFLPGEGVTGWCGLTVGNIIWWRVIFQLSVYRQKCLWDGGERKISEGQQIFLQLD